MSASRCAGPPQDFYASCCLETQQRFGLQFNLAPEVIAFAPRPSAPPEKAKRETHRAFLLFEASIDLLQQSAETVAGRIAPIELTPFLVSEIVGVFPNASQTLCCEEDSRTAFSQKL